jgi:excisionase family DNA binding protein
MQRIDGWFSLQEAARVLQVTPARVRQLIRNGQLRLYAPGRRGVRNYVQINQVYALASSPERRSRKQRRQVLSGGARPFPLPANERCLTFREAMERLDVRPAKISDLIARGLLESYQERPGQRGSRHFITLRSVQAYASDPLRQQGRRQWEARRENWTYRESHPPGTVQGEYDGAWLTVEETARQLGVAATTVLRLRRVGRLTGYRVRSRTRPASGSESGQSLSIRTSRGVSWVGWQAR